VVATAAEQVDVHRRADRRRSPGDQHHGSLEHEPVAMRRLRESVEEPFHREVLQQFGCGAMSFLGDVVEALADRYRQVPDRLRHRIASR
jgi:hypothetical protein